MKVKEVMTPNAQACTLTTNLAEVAGLMWDKDCGIVPVVADSGKIVGLITDRDICMAAATKGRNLVNIAVEDVITGEVFSCKADDDIRTALGEMKRHKVRRLPVVAAEGGLEGILSMNDVVLKAEEAGQKKVPELSYGDVVNTYKAICEHREEPGQPKRMAADV